MRKLFLYLKFYIQADTAEMRARASEEAYKWCIKRHKVHWIPAYNRDFTAFTDAYTRAYCHNFAKTKLTMLRKD